jgi:hypothetical protein
VERAAGIEPASSAWKAEVIAIIRCPHGSNLERVMGIEPTLLAWEAKVLPLNYTRLVWALLYAFFHLNQRTKRLKRHIPVRLRKL